MKPLLRRYLGLFMALAIALTAHGAAAAQGNRDASGQMVICTGTGPVVVYVDDDGQPVQPPHYCPDCVMQLLDAVSVPVTLCAPDATGVAALPVPVPALTHGRNTLRASARAPPVPG